jgi:hypothetical protein
MHIPRSGYGVFGAFSQKDIQANIAFVRNLNKTLGDSGKPGGKTRGRTGSTPEANARIVRLSPNSRQAPNSAQTWLPKNSSSALDEVPKPY